LNNLYFSSEVNDALKNNLPIVALESTVITHGLPIPKNLETAIAMENTVRSAGSIPATICLIEGLIRIGLDNSQLETLSRSKDAIKVSIRDMAGALLNKNYGGTTVSGTMSIANMVGVKIFATGGIGGVHRDNHMDISADLPALSKIPLLVVCSGAKSILDLPATREYLETAGIPVIGYQTDEFPAFYSKESGLKVDFRCDTPKDIADFAKLHWGLGLNSTVLVTVPVPDKSEIPFSEIEGFILLALEEMKKKNICGAALTPFLLNRVSELTGGRSLKSNVDLLINNARVAGEIAVEYYR